MTSMGQHETCHSLRRHGRSTSVSEFFILWLSLGWVVSPTALRPSCITMAARAHVINTAIRTIFRHEWYPAVAGTLAWNQRQHIIQMDENRNGAVVRGNAAPSLSPSRHRGRARSLYEGFHNGRREFCSTR